MPDTVIKTRVHTTGDEEDPTERNLRVMFKALKEEGWTVKLSTRWTIAAISPDGFRMEIEVFGPDRHPVPMSDFLEDDDGEN